MVIAPPTIQTALRSQISNLLFGPAMRFNARAEVGRAELAQSETRPATHAPGTLPRARKKRSLKRGRALGHQGKVSIVRTDTGLTLAWEKKVCKILTKISNFENHEKSLPNPSPHIRY